MPVNLAKLLRPAKANPFPEVIGTFMGRDALALAVSSLGLGAEDAVLMPAYVCREVLKPFIGKTRVKLYDIRPDLEIDPEEISKKLAEDRPKVMMIVNYFGFLQPARKEIKKLCADRGVILIEDCAHSLLTQGSGDTGDLAIYSFRKTLPVPDGGGLRMSAQGNPVSAKFYPRIYSNVLSVLILLKALLKVRSEALSRAGLSTRTKLAEPEETGNTRNGRLLPLSTFARNGIGNFNFPEIIEKRRSDFQFWQGLLQKTSQCTPVYTHLPAGVCPLGFPVRVDNRDTLKSRLQGAGVFLKVHWHLPATIGSEFVNCHKLSSQMLTLPVYPELRPKERELIATFLA